MTLRSKADEINSKRKKNQGIRTDLCVNSHKGYEKTDIKKEVARQANVGEQTASRVMTINKKIDKAIAENKHIAMTIDEMSEKETATPTDESKDCR